MSSEQFSAKVEPLPGSVHARYIRCGTVGCRCARGELHGPYFRRFWREEHRTRSQYIRLEDVPAVAAACARNAEIHISRRAFRRMIRDFTRLADEVIASLEAQHTAATHP